MIIHYLMYNLWHIMDPSNATCWGKSILMYYNFFYIILYNLIDNHSHWKVCDAIHRMLPKYFMRESLEFWNHLGWKRYLRPFRPPLQQGKFTFFHMGFPSFFMLLELLIFTCRRGKQKEKIMPKLKTGIKERTFLFHLLNRSVHWIQHWALFKNNNWLCCGQNQKCGP